MQRRHMRCALGLRQMSCDRLLLLLLLVGFEVAAQAAADAPVEPQASDDFFRESGAKCSRPGVDTDATALLTQRLECYLLDPLIH